MNATRMRQAAAKVDAATPAHRDRALDGMRALALLAVPGLPLAPRRVHT